MVSRLERRFDETPGAAVPLRWFTSRTLVTADPDGGAPLLLLGADGFGRDLFSRLLHAARITLALAIVSTLGATLLGTLLGGAGRLRRRTPGRADDARFRVRSWCCPRSTWCWRCGPRCRWWCRRPRCLWRWPAIFTLLGWPIVARGVRAIVPSERAARLRAGRARDGRRPGAYPLRHLLPAARGHVASQATLLLPAFILAEATLSYLGLGFPDTTPTWGTMLQDAANVALLGDAPWTLAPAGAIFSWFWA